MIVGRVETALGLNWELEIAIPLALGRDRGAGRANRQGKGVRLDNAERFAIDTDLGRKAADRHRRVVMAAIDPGCVKTLKTLWLN
jgi:hypothetical protein